MKITSAFWRAWLAHAVPIAALALACPAQAKDLWPGSWRTDCVGYHTLKLPGNVEYPVQRAPFNRGWEPQFSDGLFTWGNDSYLAIRGNDTYGDKVLAIQVTALTDANGLKTVLDSKNAEQQKKKDEFLQRAQRLDDRPEAAKDLDPSGEYRQELRAKATQVPFYEPVPDRPAFSFPSEKPGLIDFQILIGNRIVSATRKLEGSPQQTVDAFTRYYKPREPFEVPSGRGACLPYATVTEEPEPATVGMAIRLLDHPDIVVYLSDMSVDTDAETKTPKEILDFEIARGTHGSRGAIGAAPSNKLKPFHSLTLAGQPAVGAFITIYRNNPNIRDSDERRKAPPVLDWGYVAYSPGDKNAPLGTSSTLTFKVLRYGHYAQQPMTEKEFHKLAETIAASIQRRPGAWVPN